MWAPECLRSSRFNATLSFLYIFLVDLAGPDVVFTITLRPQTANAAVYDRVGQHLILNCNRTLITTPTSTAQV